MVLHCHSNLNTYTHYVQAKRVVEKSWQVVHIHALPPQWTPYNPTQCRPFIHSFAIIIIKDLPIYLKELNREEGWRSCWLTPQMATMVRAGPSWSQKPRASSGNRMWVWGPKAFFQVISREPGCKWSSQDMDSCPYGMLALVLQVVAEPAGGLPFHSHPTSHLVYSQMSFLLVP